MKVDRQIHGLANEILDSFDAHRVKNREIGQVKNQEIKGSNKWEKIEKEIERDDKVNELEQKNYEEEMKNYYHKMMGCGQDHAVELDIYNKPYPEKIKRIKMMKE